MLIFDRGADTELLTLLEEAGRNVQRSGMLLHDLLVDYPEHAGLTHELKLCEQEGDRITHDIIYRLARGKSKTPFDASDGHKLATALDDIVDEAEHAGMLLDLYQVEASMEQAVEMATVLVGAGEQLSLIHI